MKIRKPPSLLQPALCDDGCAEMEQETIDTGTSIESGAHDRRWKLVGFSTLLFAALQALCPAVIAISAVRVVIGVGALAAAAGTDAAPRGLHADIIRIPMMLLALAGALLNLFVIWHVRRLRRRPASQWRLQPVTKEKLRSERLQIALALLTFFLLAAEWLTHPLIHRPHQ